jgi:hypothetical protein
MSLNNKLVENKYKSQEKEGKKILKKNNFFQDFTSLMRNSEFRNFYNQYFKDWSDIQTMIFYMKMYSTIEEIYFIKYHEHISDELMTHTLHKIITTNETRKASVELFKEFKGENNELIVNKKRITSFEALIDFESNKKLLLLK